MSTKSLVLDGAKIVRSANLILISKIAKNFKKNIKFDLQGYLNMKMMFNGLDRPFELLNLKYEREVQKILCFAKHHSITLYIYI
jgi:hypothetical protein